VGPMIHPRCMASLESIWVPGGPLDPCAAHVAVYDSSRVASHGLMLCHGHMASYVESHRHMVWCGSHQAHMISVV
jgi:hypothetical protein